ncbi:hypothetical protein BU24DRAFT_483262 [Aaosphaeria arxii CBS 175.79]|uniref:Uncharacterized protein n=1 Tax=Aaosphaeria arxii CBS 175.79 TaxID=1450172 RepID=A0A6A5XKV8_9PLEO|nr:uncharacterized protein BU24DRAFT_483262 [Aaosphaeria arxii CBS 175.79]KAF2013489.1 hypothetical protein BU24DRAFT_483262 [Aaosphaeria arxii CBS 175.79]
MVSDIDTRLSYRTGWPILPALPVIHTDLDWSDYPDLQREIWAILINNQVDAASGVMICTRSNMGVPESDRKPTIFIIVGAQRDDEASRVQAVRDIKNLLQSRGIELAVELYANGQYIVDDSTFPIRSTDTDLLQWWELNIPLLVDTISPHNWLSIDFILRGSEKRPTVFISADDANDWPWWIETIPFLRDHIPPHIDIELKYMKHLDSGEDDVKLTGDKTIPTDDYECAIQMGASCGISGHPNSGVVGGFVKLEKDGRDLGHFALTNQHVLPKEVLTGEEEFTNSDGFKEHITDRPRLLPVVSPSDFDHNLKVQELEGRIESTKYLVDNEDEIRAWGERRQEIIIENSYNLVQLRRELGTVSSLMRNVGQIYEAELTTSMNEQFVRRWKESFVPGEVTQYPWVLDWGLIQFDRHIQPCTDIPESGENYENLISEYCSLEPRTNYNVVQYGRTSTWRQGVVSAAVSVLNSKNLRGKCSKDKTPGIPVLCHSIVVEKTNNAETKDPYTFLSPFDSGCWVFLNERVKNPQILGSGLGCNPGSRVSYMMPMDCIIRRIEDSTGAKVIEPRKGPPKAN